MTLKNISYIFHFYLRWVNPLIKKGRKNELRMGDIYKWTFDSDATTLANELEGYVLKLEIHFSKMILRTSFMVLTFKRVHQGALKSFQK